MRQILQNLKTGVTDVAELPAPHVGAGQLLICTARTLVSAGTERMLVEFGRASLIDKARQQPDKVRQVLDKVRTDGLLETLDAVRSKLDQPIALGYCNVGVVAELGRGVEGFAVGDRVVSNGKHAEIVCVPKNLCARVPDAVPDDSATFAVLAAVGLQGVRLANPTLGECVVVTGLGLIGLLTVQLLKAQGCRVLGIDYDATRLALARQFGADTVDLSRGEDPLAVAAAFSRGRGVDAVIISTTTKSNDPVTQATHMCRKRGRIVLVGVAGLGLSRADFYEKELSFQVSCSYGPGRYDAAYEERGQDYPVAFVRWTEQRNFEAVLDLMATGALDVAPLVSHRFAFQEAEAAYKLLSSDTSSLGILLTYSTPQLATEALLRRTISLGGLAPVSTHACVGFVGAGNYAGRMLMPAFKAAGAALNTVVTTGGVNGLHYARKFGFEKVSTDLDALLGDATVDTVVIATRHDSHARLVLQALAAGKHVFVEKPLALTLVELAAIEDAYQKTLESGHRPVVMVGFNRRFAPHMVKIKELLAQIREPKCIVMTINAGILPPEHWHFDREIGGGRLVSEGCHFVDLARHIVGAPIIDVSGRCVGASPALIHREDKFSLTLKFKDGSMATIHYFGNGHKGYPKEHIQIFAAGRILSLDNFITLRGYGWGGFSKNRLWRQDKGQQQCVTAFIDAVRDQKPNPIPLEEIVEISRVCLEADGMLRNQP